MCIIIIGTAFGGGGGGSGLADIHNSIVATKHIMAVGGLGYDEKPLEQSYNLTQLSEMKLWPKV